MLTSFHVRCSYVYMNLNCTGKGKVEPAHGDPFGAAPSFGFWVSLLGPRGLHKMRLWRPVLHKAFPNARLSRQAVHQPLDRLRTLQNRITHHEPILQRQLADDDRNILQVLTWICTVAAVWVDDHGTVQALLAARPRHKPLADIRQGRSIAASTVEYVGKVRLVESQLATSWWSFHRICSSSQWTSLKNAVSPG